MTEAVRPLEILHRTAEKIGAVVCLSTDHDGRASGGGRRIRSAQEGASLSRLSIVAPHADRDLCRWARLQRGEVLAACQVIDAVPLDDIASLLLEELADMVRRRA